MPILSLFYGIIVRMYMEVGGKHNMPHIHAEYAGKKIVMSLDGEILQGDFPSKQLQLLKAWSSPMSNHGLLLHFSTGERTIFDVTPYIKGSWFGQLKDTSYFTKVQIISHGEGIAWPDGQDIAPHELYDLSIGVR